MNFLRLLLCLPALIAVVGCGGGGGGGEPDWGDQQTPPPAAVRPGLHYVYYGSRPGQLQETQDHITMHAVNPWWSLEDQTEDMMKSPVPLVLHLENVLFDGNRRLKKDARPWLINRLTYLSQINVLYKVKVIYTADEPGQNGLGEGDYVAAVELVKQVIAGFPELEGVKFAVIYGGPAFKAGKLYGLELNDWIGFDDYGTGVGVLESIDKILRPKLRPDQRIILVPGGAAPWNEDPDPYLIYANGHEDVICIMPFIWTDNYGSSKDKGIETGERRDEYMALGKRIKETQP